MTGSKRLHIPPTEPDAGLACPAVVVYAKDPVMGACCEYSDPCHAPSGWVQYNTMDECQGTAGCVEGDMYYVDNGCNVCTCTGGIYQCTTHVCAEKLCGAMIGDTCSETEYCAYVDGDLCGAADATSTCQPRPQACDLDYAPVCACNGQTYSNECAANMAGFGVNYSGECM